MGGFVLALLCLLVLSFNGACVFAFADDTWEAFTNPLYLEHLLGATQFGWQYASTGHYIAYGVMLIAWFFTGAALCLRFLIRRKALIPGAVHTVLTFIFLGYNMFFRSWQ